VVTQKNVTEALYKSIINIRNKETKMDKETHINRYGNKFTFTEDPDGNILWEGNFEYIRTSLNENKDIIMIDPGGGPYLSKGMPSTIAHPEIEDKEIVKFQEIKTGFKIILK
jgi:hypothetical protein